MGRVADPTERALALLGLLQARPVWTGRELAARLGVTSRSVRRDVARLRALGYAVAGEQGPAGGYRLEAGRALPPLLLDDEEAVAVAVSLRLVAGMLAGAGDAAVGALTKLEQVLPPRLRSEIRALHESVETLPGPVPAVTGERLLALARACRAGRRVGFSYTRPGGSPEHRAVEPERLVAAAGRWYLLAWDLDRADWRVFRVDRLGDLVETGQRTRPAPHPDPVAAVHEAVSAAPYRHRALVAFAVPADQVREVVHPLGGMVRTASADSCTLELGTHDLGWLARHLAGLGLPFTVIEPPELHEQVAALAHLLVRAVSPERTWPSAPRTGA